MDEKIQALVNELKSSLYETKEFKEYFALKALYEKDEEIKSILLILKSTPKDSKEYRAALEEYNSHPLITNYNHAKKEVESILRTIKDIINK